MNTISGINGSGSMARTRNAAICARVIVLSGQKVLSSAAPQPSVIPHSATSSMLSSCTLLSSSTKGTIGKMNPAHPSGGLTDHQDRGQWQTGAGR